MPEHPCYCTLRKTLFLIIDSQSELRRGKCYDRDRIVRLLGSTNLFNLETARRRFHQRRVYRIVFKNKQALEQWPPARDVAPALNFYERTVLVLTRRRMLLLQLL